jgi:uncharacterized membrane protein YgdD (TMEM256/DUF423 family)
MNLSAGKTWLVIGAVLGFLAVALGAFGAHGLETSFKGSISGDFEKALKNWNTAAQYQMYHALALLAVGLIAARRPGRSLSLAGSSFTLGTLIFSGCLYAMVLTGQRWLGAIVPIGGTLLIVGWVFLAIAALRLPSGANSAGE